MNNARALLASFAGACALLAALIWWYRPASVQALAIFLAAWVVVGLGCCAVELATMPTDASMPPTYRIAGKVFRGIVAVTGIALVVAILLSVGPHASQQRVVDRRLFLAAPRSARRGKTRTLGAHAHQPSRPRLRLSKRLKVTAALYMIFALITAILDAFVQTETLNYLIFHSVVFHVALFSALMLMAPVFARLVG